MESPSGLWFVGGQWLPPSRVLTGGIGCSSTSESAANRRLFELPKPTDSPSGFTTSRISNGATAELLVWAFICVDLWLSSLYLPLHSLCETLCTLWFCLSCLLPCISVFFRGYCIRFSLDLCFICGSIPLISFDSKFPSHLHYLTKSDIIPSRKHSPASKRRSRAKRSCYALVSG